MNISETVLLLTMANALFLCLLIYLGLRLNRTRKILIADAQQVENDMVALCRVSSNVDRRIDAIDEKLRRLSERQEKLEASDSVKREYEKAIRAVKGGASLDRLIDIHGLSQAEAKLLLSLHASEERQLKAS